MNSKFSLARLVACAVSIFVMFGTSWAAEAQQWARVGEAGDTEFSVDLESLKWEGRTVTYWVLYKSLSSKEKFETAKDEWRMDCENRLRRGIYSVEYRRDGTQDAGEIDGGWKPIVPGTASDSIRRFLCTPKSDN